MKKIKYLGLFFIGLVSLFIDNVLADTNFYLNYEFMSDVIDISRLETIKQNFEDNYSNYDFDYIITYIPYSEYSQTGGNYKVYLLRKLENYSDTEFYIQPYIRSRTSSSAYYDYAYSISAFNLTSSTENNTNFNKNFCHNEFLLHFDADDDILVDQNYNDMNTFITNPTTCYTGSTSNFLSTGSYRISKSSLSNNPLLFGLEEQEFIYYSSVPLHYVNNNYKVSQSQHYNSLNDYCTNPTNRPVNDGDYYYYFYDHLYYVSSSLEELNCGDPFPTYSLYTNMPNISVGERNFRYTEEDNDFIYKKILTININDLYLNNNYKISYKYVDDLENEIRGTINESNTEIEIYMNGTLSVYIRDNDNNLIDSYVSPYQNFGVLSQRAAFDSNGNGNNMYSLNVHYNFGNMQRYSTMPFRIMYYSNDFSENNTPRLVGYKKYYINANNSKSEIEKDFNLFDIENLKCNKYGNQVICTGYIKNMLVWNNFEIDFLFNDIENYSIHYFDQFSANFSARDIDVLSNDLVGYTKYRFPKNSDRAYIYKKNAAQNNKTGSVVFPFYYLGDNETLKIKANYDKTSVFLSDLQFENNEYYRKFDFDLSNYEVLTISLNRIRICDTGLLDFLVGNEKFCENDSAYIYVSNDFIVNFNDFSSGDNYSILTDDDGNEIIIKDDYNIDNLFSNVSNYLYEIRTYTNIFTDLLSYFYNSQNSEIKNFLIATFIVLVISAVVILARRR